MTSNVAMKLAMGDCKIIILEAREICNDMPTTFKKSTLLDVLEHIFEYFL